MIMKRRSVRNFTDQEIPEPIIEALLDAANNAPHVAFQVGEKPVVDLTDYLRGDWKYWSPVDTSFGSSVYEVIDPAYEYTVYRTQSALLIRKEIITASRYEGGALVIQIEKPCNEF